MDGAELTQAIQALDPLVWWVVGAAVLLLAGLAVAVAVRRRRQRAALRRRYGAEYDRTSRRAGSSRRAAAELRAREDRRRDYAVRRLAAGERERLRSRWEALQASFVDGPETAVRSAEELVTEVAATRGYAPDGGDPLEDVGVDHPLALDRYRASRPEGADRDTRPTTERLRRALLASRDLFETLVGPDGTADEAPSPFRRLLDEEPEEVRGAEHRERAAVAAQPPEIPLYGPDGRPLGDVEAGRRR